MSHVTLLFLISVSILYSLLILRRAVRTKIDLFDFIFLFTVVLIPCSFGLFESLAYRFSHAVGIQYPFVLMFAMIHACSFIYFSYLAARLNRLRHREVHLIQEISLLKEQMQRWRAESVAKTPP